MKRLLILLLALCASAPATIAQGLPRALALTVSVNTNGVLVAPTNFWAANSNSIVALTGGGGGAGGGTNYLFDTNSFVVTGTNVFAAPTQYLTADRIIDGGANDWDFVVQDMALTDIEGVNAILAGLTTLTVDGQRSLEILARTNLYLWTPQAWALNTATNRVLAITDTGTAAAEYIGIERANMTSGTNLLNALLVGWAASGAYTLTSATRDTNSVVTSATIRWPDGATGTFTTTSNNPVFFSVDAFTITHSASGKTVTQPAVTRNSYGDITAQPAISVSP